MLKRVLEIEVMDSAAALETRALNKRFGGVIAADNIDFRVQAGELRFMIGPNGAGKSTLFAMLCGIQTADSGQIFIAGRDVTLDDVALDEGGVAGSQARRNAVLDLHRCHVR